MIKEIIFVLVVLSILPITSALDISSCQTLNANTYYKMINSIDTSSVCMIIGGNNVTLDMNGFNITGNGNSGIYSNKYNKTTIKNGAIYKFDYGVQFLNNLNNSLINLTLNDNNGGAGIKLNNSDYNFISDCSLNNDMYNIYLTNGSENNRIENSIITGTKYAPSIYSESLSNNNIYKNLNLSNNIYGIWIFLSSNNTFSDSIVNSNNQEGITLYSSSNNTLSNITANSNGDYGLYIYSISDNNNISDITTNSNGDYGIHLVSSSNNILSNINSNLNNKRGVSVISSSNNTLSNITANSNGEQGIFLVTSPNNTFNKITLISNNQDGLKIYGSSNNTFKKGYINNSGNYGIYIFSDVAHIDNNNLFKDILINNTFFSDVNITTDNPGSEAINNTFLNVSYSRPEDISNSGDGGTIELIRKWYVNVRVNYTTGHPTNNALVYGYDINNILIDNDTTNSQGLATLKLSSYRNLDGIINYYPNYTLGVTKFGSSTPPNQSINVTGNLDSVFFLLRTKPPHYWIYHLRRHRIITRIHHLISISQRKIWIHR